jgi:hypothetical protein
METLPKFYSKTTNSITNLIVRARDARQRKNRGSEENTTHNEWRTHDKSYEEGDE